MGDALFQFLFKYPPVAYQRGHLALTARWPAWVLALLILAASALIAWNLLRQQAQLSRGVQAFVWAAQSVTLAMLLTLLWRPALMPDWFRGDVLAVLVDDSASMAMNEGGSPHQEIERRSTIRARWLRNSRQVQLRTCTAPTFFGACQRRDLKATGTSTRLRRRARSAASCTCRWREWWW
jgi:hypothetical protein